DDGNTLLLLDDADAAPREVRLPAAAATVVGGGDGAVLAPAAGVVARVDVDTGALEEVQVDGDARSAAVLADGRWAVGTAEGQVLILDPTSGEVATTIEGLASADALAVTGDTVAVLDRGQTSLTELNLEDGRLGIALRAGEGATQLVTDPFGRVVVADTRDDELLVYTLDALILRQRYPAGPAPYGLAYGAAQDLVWVTLTGSNEVVGYDLSTGIPRERHRFATVRQPNSIVVDPADGALVIASATGDGLQRIPIEG
ncbi:NHL repeat-containing protein, partial [Rhodococcus chondri]